MIEPDRFSDKFKRDAVALTTRRGYAFAEVSKRLDMGQQNSRATGSPFSRMRARRCRRQDSAVPDGTGAQRRQGAIQTIGRQRTWLPISQSRPPRRVPVPGRRDVCLAAPDRRTGFRPIEDHVMLDALDMALAARNWKMSSTTAITARRYISLTFGNRCKDANVRPSTGSVGGAYQNDMCQTFFATWNAICSIVTASALIRVFNAIAHHRRPTQMVADRGRHHSC